MKVLQDMDFNASCLVGVEGIVPDAEDGRENFYLRRMSQETDVAVVYP